MERSWIISYGVIESSHFVYEVSMLETRRGGWRKSDRLCILLTNKTILVWIDRSLGRRAEIICVVLFVEDIIKSVRFFADQIG